MAIPAVNRVTRLRAENFRCIDQLDLELSPLTVMIGPNGAGKSSVLQLANMFSGIAEGSRHLNRFFSTFGGYDATLSDWATVPSMMLGVTVGSEGYELHYDLEFLGESGGYFVSREQLRQRSSRDEGEEKIFDRLDTKVSMLSAKMGRTGGSVPHSPEPHLFAQGSHIPHGQAVLDGVRGIHLVQGWRFQPGSVVRRPQQLQPTQVPANDGSDLFAALYTMQTDRPDCYGELIEHLRLFMPGLENIDFPASGAGHINLRWKQSGLSKPLYVNQLSDGFLRMLWLVTVLHSAPDDGLLLIDEPELGLHPQWILLLVSMMRKTSGRTTVLVATQSAELVRWIEPEELIIADLDDGRARFARVGDRSDITNWLKDFTLDELWTMGELGGRP
ncbi:MAG: AAA family ATPase [Planctomycetes bacterium]|nr:AAA family ATPase [Planctomycetota bacterium]